MALGWAVLARARVCLHTCRRLDEPFRWPAERFGSPACLLVSRRQLHAMGIGHPHAVRSLRTMDHRSWPVCLPPDLGCIVRSSSDSPSNRGGLGIGAWRLEYVRTCRARAIGSAQQSACFGGHRSICHTALPGCHGGRAAVGPYGPEKRAREASGAFERRSIEITATPALHLQRAQCHRRAWIS